MKRSCRRRHAYPSFTRYQADCHFAQQQAARPAAKSGEPLHQTKKKKKKYTTNCAKRKLASPRQKGAGGRQLHFTPPLYVPAVMLLFQTFIKEKGNQRPMANASGLLGRGKEKVMVLYGTGITDPNDVFSGIRLL